MVKNHLLVLKIIFLVKIYISEIKVEVESVVEFSKLPISEFKKNSIRFY